MMPTKRLRRFSSCGKCERCTRSNCGRCNSCLDMLKFGGPGKLKQVCKERECLHKSDHSSTAVTPKANTTTALTASKGQRSLFDYAFKACKKEDVSSDDIEDITPSKSAPKPKHSRNVRAKIKAEPKRFDSHSTVTKLPKVKVEDQDYVLSSDSEYEASVSPTCRITRSRAVESDSEESLGSSVETVAAGPVISVKMLNSQELDEANDDVIRAECDDPHGISTKDQNCNDYERKALDILLVNLCDTTESDAESERDVFAPISKDYGTKTKALQQSSSVSDSTLQFNTQRLIASDETDGQLGSPSSLGSTLHFDTDLLENGIWDNGSSEILTSSPVPVTRLLANTSNRKSCSTCLFADESPSKRLKISEVSSVHTAETTRQRVDKVTKPASTYVPSDPVCRITSDPNCNKSPNSEFSEDSELETSFLELDEERFVLENRIKAISPIAVPEQITTGATNGAANVKSCREKQSLRADQSNVNENNTKHLKGGENRGNKIVSLLSSAVHNDNPDSAFNEDAELEKTFLDLDEKTFVLENIAPVVAEPHVNSPDVPVPYYLNTLQIAMEEVLSNATDISYFDSEEDLPSIAKFQCCSDNAQRLYARMLVRQHAWISYTNLKYDDVDKRAALGELIANQLLKDNSEVMDLHELLSMLSAQSVGKLCKDLKVATNVKGKRMMIDELMKHAQSKNLSTMFETKISTEEAIRTKCKMYLPQCYKLLDGPLGVFQRILMLFSLTFENLQDPEATSQAIAYAMLRINLGQLKYPHVSTNRTVPIFRNRQDVLRLHHAQRMESTIVDCLSKKQFYDGFEVFREAISLYREWSKDTAMLDFDCNLPPQYRRYTCMYKLIRVLAYSAEVLEKLRKYEDAARQYDILLRQEIYGGNSRGQWWDRLTLIQDYHLKQKEKALENIGRGMHDNCIRSGHKFELYRRAQKITKNNAAEKGIHHSPVTELAETVISGSVLKRSVPGTDRLHIFAVANGRGEVSTHGVEEIAKMHYMQKYQLTKGHHAEGAIFTTIYGLLFWDIIFKADINDTFYSRYQCQPLDMQTDLFYIERKMEIDAHIQLIRHSSIDTLGDMISNVWNAHFSECCVCVSWDLFESAEDVKGLIRCFGVEFTSAFCERFSKFYRHCRSGLPDLTMWNPETGQYKIVEVKGPGDRLSTKQILWIDYMIKHGANGNVEVCRVNAGAKIR